MTNISTLEGLFDFRRGDWNAAPPPRGFEGVSTHPRIEIHHSAGASHHNQDPAGVLAAIDADHRRRGWNGIFYNVLVDRDGRLWEARGVGRRSIGGARAAYDDTTPVNVHALTVLLPGNHNDYAPTQVQLDTIDRLRLAVPDQKAQVHQWRDNTACPGAQAIMAIQEINQRPPIGDNGMQPTLVGVGHDSFGQWYNFWPGRARAITAEAAATLRFLGYTTVPVELVDLALGPDGWVAIDDAD